MHTREPERIYARQLPGGGFVVIDVTPARTFLGRQCFRGEVVVERRTEEHRRYGHSPPVLAQAEAGTIGGVLHKLLPTARSNTAIAVSCLARQGERAPPGEAERRSKHHVGKYLRQVQCFPLWATVLVLRILLVRS